VKEDEGGEIEAKHLTSGMLGLNSIIGAAKMSNVSTARINFVARTYISLHIV